MIVAKFTCTRIDMADDADHVYMTAVVTTSDGADDPNRSWSEATPAGDLSLVVSNPAARGQFKVGRDYLLRFDEHNE